MLDSDFQKKYKQMYKLGYIFVPSRMSDVLWYCPNKLDYHDMYNYAHVSRPI
jgi:hypothetical protein